MFQSLCIEQIRIGAILLESPVFFVILLDGRVLGNLLLDVYGSREYDVIIRSILVCSNGRSNCRICMSVVGSSDFSLIWVVS
jgi:hypothetical protein